MKPPRGVVLVLSTAPRGSGSGRIAPRLVEEGLAACVNVLSGVRSVYRWKGRVERAAEDLLLIKTVRGRLEALERRLRTLHPYEVPEILAIPVGRGGGAYLDWVVSESRRAESLPRKPRRRPRRRLAQPPASR